jgi:imidazolonepropionase-like amidohydrolase
MLMALLAALPACVVAEEPGPPVLALSGARLYDDRLGACVPGRILVRDGRIAAVGPEVEVPAGATELRLDGKWIIPGLVDAHIHFFQSGGLYTRPDALDLTAVRSYREELDGIRAGLDETFRRYLRCGITAVVDVGGPYGNFAVRERAQGLLQAPRVAVAGPLLSSWRPPRLDSDDPPILRVTTRAAAIAEVDRQAARHPDLVKIWFIVGQGETVASFSPIVAAIVEESHRLGLRVAVHATELATAKAALACGADVLVHSVRDELDGEFVRLLVERRVPLIPTLIVHRQYGRVWSGRYAPTAAEDRLADPFVLGTFYDLWQLPAALVPERIRRAMAEPSEPGDDLVAGRNLLRLQHAGAVVAAGTDAGNPGTLPGPALYREFAAMAAAGLTAAEILHDATANGAVVMGRAGELGRIAPGLLADLVVLDADPLADIRNVARIALVIKGGVALRPEEILAETPVATAQRVLNEMNGGDIEAILANCTPGVRIGFDDGRAGALGRDAVRVALTLRVPLAPRANRRLLSRRVDGGTVVEEHRVLSLSDRRAHAETVTYRFATGLIDAIAFAAGPGGGQP